MPMPMPLRLTSSHSCHIAAIITRARFIIDYYRFFFDIDSIIATLIFSIRHDIARRLHDARARLAYFRRKIIKSADYRKRKRCAE